MKFKGRYPEICERTGLDYSWLSKFARGVRGKRPSLDQFTKLIHALDQIELADAAVLASSAQQENSFYAG